MDNKQTQLRYFITTNEFKSKMLASKWKILLAKIFGKKYRVLDFSVDGNCEVTAYRFRKVLYITKVSYKKHINNGTRINYVMIDDFRESE